MKTNETTPIPQGYKATPLGIIPQEWKIMPLYEAFHLQSGYAFKSEFFSTDQGIPIVRISNLPINNKYIDLSDCVYYPASENIKQQFIVHKKDLLIAMSGATTGKTAIYNYAFNAYLNQRVGVFKQTSDKVCYQYLQTIVESQLFTTKLQPLLIAGAQPNISPSDIENMTFPFPPLKEQQKIAEVLGLWDKAIEKQSQLIEQLTLRKRGLMQQLLTAKRRLPVFSGPWKKVRLGDIGDTYNGLSGKNKDDFEYGNAQFIPYINVFSNERIDTNNLGCVQIEPNEQQNTVKYGDIFFTVSSETPDEVGMASVLLEYLDNTYLNSFCFGYRLNDFSTLNPFFAAYLFRTEHFRSYMSVLAQGSTRFNISKKEVMKLKIDLPTIEEQTAIAQVLTAADREIELAQQKLELLRQQKCGLMQQLLTGKKRIKY